MGKRIVTGVGIVILVYSVLTLSYMPAVLKAAVTVLNLAAAYEMLRAAGAHRRRFLLVLLFAGSLLLSLMPAPKDPLYWVLLFAVACVTYLLLMKWQKRCRLDSAIVLVGLVLLTAALFRSITVLHGIEHGEVYLFTSVTLTFATDIGAYLFGRFWGSHKLAPKISPNKTVEGGIGGIVVSMACMAIISQTLHRHGYPSADGRVALLYAIGVSVVAEFGDLAMSALKRVCGIKDFGNIFPGHGGALDRFDSLMFSAPFTLVICLLTGGWLLV